MKGDMKSYELAQFGLRVFFSISAQLDDTAPEISFFLHKHPYFEMHILTEGSMTLRAGSGSYELQAGEFCLVSPGVLHAPKNTETRSRRVCICFEPITRNTQLKSCLENQLRGIPVYTGPAGEMLAIVEQLEKEYTRHLRHADEVIPLLLSHLLILLIRVTEKTVSHQPKTLQNSNELRTALIDTFLNNNFCAGDRELAQHLGVSRRQLDRILKKLYGKSFREKSKEVRLEIAFELLNTDCSIREISERLGYSTPSNFTSFFRSEMGMTPSEYRQQLTGVASPLTKPGE